MLSTSHLPGQTWGQLTAFAPPSSSRTETFNDAIQHTQSPIMTGTSVLGIKYNGGVLLAADTLVSVGSMARFDNIQRLHSIGTHTCMAAGGDLSDFQELQHVLDSKVRDESVMGDGHHLSSSQIYEWLTRLMYARRSKMDPLWLALLVGGWEKGQPFLAHVDLLGTTYTSPTLATGYGAYIAQPLLRKAVEGREGQLSREEAEKVIEDCMRILFYRDARTINKYQIAHITADGVEISKPKSLETSWGFAESLKGFATR